MNTFTNKKLITKPAIRLVKVVASSVASSVTSSVANKDTRPFTAFTNTLHFIPCRTVPVVNAPGF